MSNWNPTAQVLIVNKFTGKSRRLHVRCTLKRGSGDLCVAGTASDGRIALSKIDQLKPDLITLDIEMPVMGGLETLAEVRKLLPKLPGDHVQHAYRTEARSPLSKP